MTCVWMELVTRPLSGAVVHEHLGEATTSGGVRPGSVLQHREHLGDLKRRSSSPSERPWSGERPPRVRRPPAAPTAADRQGLPGSTPGPSTIG